MLKFIVHWVIRFLLFFLCKVDREALKAVPREGPMILVGNHINFLDAPVAATFMYPRKIVSLVKKETFDNPLLDFLFRIWGSIPVNRGTADFNALGRAVNVLEQGQFFAIFPEGTRTNNGCLVRGHSGVVVVALKSGVPILPIVLYGTEKFPVRFRKLRRTRITFRVGEPFLLCPGSAYPRKEERQQMTDEIMYQLARLLPEENRGYYSDLSKATTQFLNFDIAEGKCPEAELKMET
ncbi:MAG: lysophospholipid acyltransferase family protein [Bacillota bacterium]|nr:lysophospholipid acyltransferase family protein [Bacillota bacterium]